MQYPHDVLPARLAQGWMCMLAAFAGGLLMSLVRDAVNNDFSAWGADPGPAGLRACATLMVVYIVMPMLLRHLDARWFRWLATGIAVFCGLFILTHQLAHALTATRPFDVTHAFDFLHHVLAAWVVLLTARWARQDTPAPVATAALAPR